MKQAKESKTPPPFAPGDIVIVFLCLLLLFWFIRLRPEPGLQGNSFELYQVDSLILTDTFYTHTEKILLEHDSLFLKITDSSVSIDRSSCGKNICVHSGEISHPGEEIICLPLKVILRIPGEGSSDADIIAR